MNWPLRGILRMKHKFCITLPTLMSHVSFLTMVSTKNGFINSLLYKLEL